MVDYKHQACRYVFSATEGDVRRWGRYKKNSMLRRLIRDIKWLNI